MTLLIPVTAHLDLVGTPPVQDLLPTAMYSGWLDREDQKSETTGACPMALRLVTLLLAHNNARHSLRLTVFTDRCRTP